MKVVLTYETALRYWRLHELAATTPTNTISLADATAAKRSVKECCIPPSSLEGEKIQLLVGSSASRAPRAEIQTLAWQGDLPRNSVRKLSDHLFVSTPEMCFLQFCARNSLARSVLLGMELCGTYSVGLDGKGCLYNRLPLTSPEQLRVYINECARHKGAKAARVALRHIVGGSASPMESVLALLLCMPVRLGGYALPKPSMNETILLDGDAAQMAGKSSYRCDLYWPDQRVALEYNSVQYHADSASMSSDYHRANVLSFLGNTVISVTWPAIRDVHEFDSLYRILVRKLGVRFRKETEGSEFAQSRTGLRKEIMTPIVF